jgi:hypothetical protein
MTGSTAMSFADSVGNNHLITVQTEETYMELGLRLVTKIVAGRVRHLKDYPLPFDFDFCTNQSNLAKAVTRAFILGRQWQQDGTDPVRELKRRQFNVELWLPLVTAVRDMYALAKGVRQTGHIGSNSLHKREYMQARDLVHKSGFKLPKRIRGPQGSK